MADFIRESYPGTDPGTLTLPQFFRLFWRAKSRPAK